MRKIVPTIWKSVGALSFAFAIVMPIGGSFAADLAEQFANPPSQTRILKIIHTWPDAVAAQDGLIRTLNNQGFGGVVCNVSFETYLESETKWQAFTRAVGAAKAVGMMLWLYDEKGYPSANAGGIVLRGHPEWQARGLLIADSQTDSGAVSLHVPPGEIILAAAYPIVNGGIDLKGEQALTDRIANGKLSWKAPDGRWQVLVITEDALFEGTHAAMNLHEKMPYPNLLLPEVTQRFLEVTHAEYAKHLGNDFGKLFQSTFTDEPSLMSCFLQPMPYRVLPWAQNLPNEFEKRRGYALKPILPLLVSEGGPASQKARYDFWLTIGELVSENYFGQIQQWCSKHNINSGGHLLSEENIATHVPLYGDFFRCIRRLDAPSIDVLTSLPPEVPWHIARLLASAAELEGKTLVMSETSDHSQRYRPAGDKRPVRSVSEEEIRGTCNRIFVSGVNTITSYYSYADLKDEQIRRLNERVGRCCLMLRGGHQVADIAVLYPAESLWTQFVPSRQWANDAAEDNRIENVYRSVSETLFAAGRDFTYVDSRGLAESKASNGELVHGNLRWRVLVLPKADTLPLAAWENLASFVKEGGLVVALGAIPANSEKEFPSPRVQAIAKEIFGSIQNEPSVFAGDNGGGGVFLPEGSESLLRSLLRERIEPDARVNPPRSPIRITHRRSAGHEIYFLINDSPELWQGAVDLRASGPCERWDPSSGQREAIASPEQVALSLQPYGATFLRFAEARPPKVTPLKTGVLPGLKLKTLPALTAKVVGGEFVKQEISTTTASSNSGAGWRAVGTITKTQVDTYLFVRLQNVAGFDLTGADSLVLETSVPEEQRASAQLLMILHEKDGGDYLAQTGRSLAAAGRARNFVPINRFQLAGWSKDANGKLDLNNIDEIRVGWGGYLGTAAERVEFTVASPQVAEEQ